MCIDNYSFLNIIIQSGLKMPVYGGKGQGKKAAEQRRIFS